MTREEVIALAREAGFVIDEEAYVRQANCISHTWHMIDEGLTRFASLVAASEREACARMCELLRPSKREYDHRFYDACTASAAVIRTRGCND